MAVTSVILSPTTRANRIEALDVLRGIAVLGILVMNIQSYSMPGAAYINPTVFENLEGNMLNVWLVSHVFADQKFMTIFSILFGGSMIMLSNKAKKEHVRSGELQYRRLGWLLIIGLIHAYFIWYGDILVAYAICGFFMFIFRRKKTKSLFRAAGIFLAMGSLITLLIGYTVPLWEPGEYDNARVEIWEPTAEDIGEEIEFYTSGWERQMFRRAPDAFKMQTTVFATSTFWRVSGLILLGMALYKKKALTAKQSAKYYVKMIGYGLGLGVPLVILGPLLNFHFEWDFKYSFFFISQLNYWGSLLMGMGYIGVIMYIMKNTKGGWLSKRLAQVGRMALTNYLMQSIICTFLFYGHGLGLFGDVDRGAQVLIVVSIWVFQIAFSAIWLNYFRFGPFEWIWRSLSYGKLQPMLSAK